MTDDLTPRLMRLAACGSQDPAQSAVHGTRDPAQSAVRDTWYAGPRTERGSQRGARYAVCRSPAYHGGSPRTKRGTRAVHA